MATVVRAKKDESNDSVIKRFKKQVLVDQVLPMVKKKEYFVKPSQIKKEQKKERERLIKRDQRIQRVYGA